MERRTWQATVQGGTRVRHGLMTRLPKRGHDSLTGTQLVSSRTVAGSLKQQESSRKTSTSALLTTPKPLPVWITTNCGKFFKRWEYQST